MSKISDQIVLLLSDCCRLKRSSRLLHASRKIYMIVNHDRELDSRPSISGKATILKELSAICNGSNHALLLPIPAAPLISSTPTSTTLRVYRVRADALRST